MSSDPQGKYLKVLEWILFFGLCCLSTYFTWGVFEKFISGQTSFSQYDDPITEIPTITFCFINSDKPITKYEYGYDFKIEYLYEGIMTFNKSIYLEEGQNLNTISGEMVNVEKLITYNFGYCYKISVVNPSMNLNRAFNIYFNESIPEKDSLLTEAYITSEDNAYGVAATTWKNGKFAKTLITKRMLNVISLKQEKYIYLTANGKCSQETFYDCVSRLLALKLGESTCGAISLPSMSNCETNETINDSLLAISEILNEAESLSGYKNGICPKLCTTVDYYGELSISRGISFLPHENSATFVLAYRFKQHSVTVFKEYVIYDAISMIGSVGGTLGMCIGFSFTSLVTYMINQFHHAFTKIKPNLSIHKSSLQNYHKNGTTYEDSHFYQMKNIDRYNMQLKMEINAKFKKHEKVLQSICTKLEDIESKLF